jgi:hypothetical protein
VFPRSTEIKVRVVEGVDVTRTTEPLTGGNSLGGVLSRVRRRQDREIELPRQPTNGREQLGRFPGATEKRIEMIDRYLHLLQEILINAIYQDRAIDPWSRPTFDARTRDSGRDWPEQALTMIGRTRLRSLRECWELALRQGIPGDFVETGIWRGGVHHDGGRAGGL